MRPVDPRLLREAPAAQRFLVAAGALGLLSAAATVAQAVLVGRIVAAVFLAHEPPAAVARELLWLLAAGLLRAAVAWALESGGRLTALRVSADLRRKLLAHLLVARPAGARGLPAGELAAATVSGLDALDPYFARFLPQLVLSAVVPAVIFAWVVLHDVASAIVLAVTLPLIPLFGILIGRVTQERTLRRFRTLSLLSAHFLDVVRGLPTLRAYRRGAAQGETIAAVSDAYRRETMGTLRIAFLSALVLELAATLSIAVIAVEIGIRLVDGGVALAPALAVLVLAPEYYGPLRATAAQFHASADGLAAAGRVFELLDLPPAAPAPARPLPVPAVADVRLERVTVAYPGRPPALSEVSLELLHGERVAVVGPSGAGKSTLLALLLRLFDPDRGRVTVGGADLVRLDPEAWRRELAWLSQRPRLGCGTLRDVLRAGSEVDDARLLAALDEAAALPVVEALPDGLDAVLGERPPLSAGELRRLALARALARPARVLLLDEPTAHLDAASAEAIARAVAALPRDRLVVVATHDERLVSAVDRVVKLRDGRVAAQPARAVA